MWKGLIEGIANSAQHGKPDFKMFDIGPVSHMQMKVEDRPGPCLSMAATLACSTVGEGIHLFSCVDSEGHGQQQREACLWRVLGPHLAQPGRLRHIRQLVQLQRARQRHARLEPAEIHRNQLQAPQARSSRGCVQLSVTGVNMSEHESWPQRWHAAGKGESVSELQDRSRSVGTQDERESDNKDKTDVDFLMSLSTLSAGRASDYRHCNGNCMAGVNPGIARGAGHVTASGPFWGPATGASTGRSPPAWAAHAPPCTPPARCPAGSPAA